MNNTKSPNDKLLPLARPKPQCHEIFVPKLAVGENVLDVDTNLSRPAYLGHISFFVQGYVSCTFKLHRLLGREKHI